MAYASRTLTETDKRFAQIEKEMLVVSFGLEKFHHYTYGRHVSVDTDHKQLVAIVTTQLSKAPKRLQALLLRKQEYNYMLTYKSGKSIPVADALSRSPLPDTPCLKQVSVNNLSFLPIKSDPTRIRWNNSERRKSRHTGCYATRHQSETTSRSHGN